MAKQGYCSHYMIVVFIHKVKTSDMHHCLLQWCVFSVCVFSELRCYFMCACTSRYFVYSEYCYRTCVYSTCACVCVCVCVCYTCVFNVHNTIVKDIILQLLSGKWITETVDVCPLVTYMYMYVKCVINV